MSIAAAFGVEDIDGPLMTSARAAWPRCGKAVGRKPRATLATVPPSVRSAARLWIEPAPMRQMRTIDAGRR